MMRFNFIALISLLLVAGTLSAEPVLKAESFQPYIERFNADDEELYTNAFPNAQAWEFLRGNIPLFECPDKELELIYYFGWWTYRKHLKQTPDGWVVTEFLPRVPWAGKHNTVNRECRLMMLAGDICHQGFKILKEVT